MNSGLYTAASGLLLEQTRLDVIGNNLANVSTSGYRPQRLFSTAYEAAASAGGPTARVSHPSVVATGSYEAGGRGALKHTGRELDVALAEGSFLAVETAAGRRYTRGGALEISPDGTLTDSLGHPLLQPSGEPVSGLGPAALLAADGSVRQNGNELAKLLVVEDSGQSLERTGNGLYAAGSRGAPEPLADPAVQPGWLEGSGSDPLQELVRMIEAQRAFETYQKLINLTMNEVNRRAVNDLAG